MKRYVRTNSLGEAESTDKFEVFRLTLSTRARNLLNRIGARTVAELREYGLEQIKVAKGCGRKTFNEILGELEKLQKVGPERYVAITRAGGEDLDKPGAMLDTGASLQLLVDELARSGYINSTQAQRILGIDSFAVRPLLRLLVEKGYALKEGRRRGMRYVRVIK